MRDLQRLHPAGYDVYVRMRRKADFLHWVDCDDVHLGLATAVHESVHMLTEELDAYPLIHGGSLPRVGPDAALLPPSAIAGKFDPGDIYVSTYLVPGQATSSVELGFLLDELNAYAHDLNAAIHLYPLARPDAEVSHRDGLAALMAFVFAYAEEARRNHQPTWQRLRAAPARTTVATLWAQAERVMGASCRLPGFGQDAPRLLARICASTASDALGQLLGRPPLCPVLCARPRLATGTGAR